MRSATLPETTFFGRYRETFARRLWDEIPRQVRSDGTHFEASVGYQRLCAEMFLLATLAARLEREGRLVPAEGLPAGAVAAPVERPPLATMTAARAAS